jgi:hypothetical protein
MTIMADSPEPFRLNSSYKIVVGQATEQNTCRWRSSAKSIRNRAKLPLKNPATCSSVAQAGHSQTSSSGAS